MIKQTLEELVDVGDRLILEPGLRAVVIYGEGRAFCAGLDMESIGAKADSSRDAATQLPVDAKLLETRTHGISNIGQYACYVWQLIPVPVIAAVHGVAVGGGFQLMIGADMRYVSPQTKMSFMEINWGMIPDMGGTQLLRGSVRDDIMKELIYTGRFIESGEALRMGVVTRVCDDPRAEAMKTARKIATRNPDAIRAAKRVYNHTLESRIKSGFLQESVEQDQLIGSVNQKVAVRAAVEKREPVFLG